MSAWASKVTLFKVCEWIIAFWVNAPYVHTYCSVLPSSHIAILGVGSAPIAQFAEFLRRLLLVKGRSVFQHQIEAMCDYSFWEFRKMMSFACFSSSCGWGINSNFMASTLYSSSGRDSWIPVFGFCHSGVLRICGFAWQCHRVVKTSCKINCLYLSCLLFLLSSWSVPLPCLLPIIWKGIT